MQMMNLKSAILEATQAIDETTTLFYQQKNPEGYQLLDHTLGVLMQAVNLISTNKLETNGIHIDELELNTVLGNAMTAIKQSDTILLSDILKFDLEKILEKYYNRL